MNLKEIREKIPSVFPPRIKLKDELLIMKKLMNLEKSEIIEFNSIFASILSDLCTAHDFTGWYEVAIDNEKKLIDFCRWMVKIDEELDLKIDSELLEFPLIGSPAWNRWLEEIDEELSESDEPLAEMFLDYYFSKG